MKRILLVFLAMAVLIPATSVSAQKLGIGAFGGINYPVLQDDQSSGTAFGVNARLDILPIITLEPFFILGSWGDPDDIDGIELGISGSSLNSFGVEASLGNPLGRKGFKPYFFGGIGYFTITNDDTDFDEKTFGFTGGLGIAIGLTDKLDIDVRARALIATYEEGSKKAVTGTAGIIYYLNLSGGE